VCCSNNIGTTRKSPVMSSVISENGNKVIKYVKGRGKINQELIERQSRAAESFAPPKNLNSLIEQLRELTREKRATISPIEIRCP
ncbi:hypothetical protein AVEN_66722-2-1, partial [Araneus ventricosus]